MCKICSIDVENEMHVLLDCLLYDNVKQDLLVKFTVKFECFIHCSKIDKLKLILGSEVEVLMNDCQNLPPYFNKMKSYVSMNMCI